MIRKKVLALSLFVFTMLLGFPSSASADTMPLGFTSSADTIVIDGVIGSTVSFDITLENPIGSGAALFLNKGLDAIDDPLTLNDLLSVNFPASLNEGTSASGILFTVDLPVGMTPGIYNGIYLILGGFTPNDFDTLAEIDFQVNAQPATNPIPEPGTWVLLATGLGVLGWAIYAGPRQKFVFNRAA